MKQLQKRCFVAVLSKLLGAALRRWNSKQKIRDSLLLRALSVQALIPVPVTERQLKSLCASGESVIRIGIRPADSGWYVTLWLNDGRLLMPVVARGHIKTWDRLDTLVSWINTRLPRRINEFAELYLPHSMAESADLPPK